MPIDPQEFAKMLGAEIVGEVPDVGGGPFDMARLAHIMHERLTPSRGEQPGGPPDPNWVTRYKVPMSDATLQSLMELAKEMSTEERKISPKQVAAHLLEEAVALLELKRALGVGGATNQFDELFAIGVLGLKREFGDERFNERVDEEYGGYLTSEQLKKAYEDRYNALVKSWKLQREAVEAEEAAHNLSEDSDDDDDAPSTPPKQSVKQQPT